MHHLAVSILITLNLLLPAFIEAISLRSLDTAPVSHFTLARRGGPFASTEFSRDYVNLTHLIEEQDKAESRFSLTKREVRGNKLVRKAKATAVGGGDEGLLMGEVAADGIW